MTEDIDPLSLPTADFVAALRRGTSHVWSVQAAVWLLEQHGLWLDDPRFRACVEVGDDGSGELWAGIDVQRVDAAIDARELGPWGEDLAVLQFVLSLQGNYPIPLRYTCENLSEENLALIGKALSLACGHGEPW